MKNLLQKIPSLRITIAFAFGILLSAFVKVHILILIASSATAISILVILHRNYTYRREPLFGWIAIIAFVLLGAIVFQSHNHKPNFHVNGTFTATVLECPEEKPSSYKILIRLNTVSCLDTTLATNEIVLTYFEKSNAAKNLKPGNTIVFKRNPEIIENSGNPFEFDYKAYLDRSKIYRQLYLPADEWQLIGIQRNSVIILAEKTREKLLSIYREKNLGENETAILSALTLGYKRGLDPETKRVFSAAGAMHVLAVSGLHVGIIFGIYTLAFGFLRKRKYGKIFYVITAVLLLWVYAFITGLSPSVMRAATMFSLVCIAVNINRRASIYNSLSVSALALLIINPNNLFELGFQLSYAAVFGIVFLQSRISNLWPVKNKIYKFFWTLLTVSIAAQVATFPITSYYFNQFPIYFWLSNLLVIPAVFVLISLGISLLVFSSVPFIGQILAFVTKWSIKLVYLFLAWIENLPCSVWEINFNRPELLLLLTAYAMGLVFLEYPRIKYMKYALMAVLGLTTVKLTNQYKQLHSSEMIVYNTAPDLVVHLIKGKSNYLISKDSISDADFVGRHIETVRKKKELEAPVMLNFHGEFNNGFIYINKGIILFDGITIWIDPNQEHLPKLLPSDYILCTKSQGEFPYPVSAPTIISNSYPRNKKEQEIFYLRERGAFHIQWQ